MTRAKVTQTDIMKRNKKAHDFLNSLSFEEKQQLAKLPTVEFKKAMIEAMEKYNSMTRAKVTQTDIRKRNKKAHDFLDSLSFEEKQQLAILPTVEFKKAMIEAMEKYNKAA